MKKVLLTGSNGLLGQNLLKQFLLEKGFEIIATSRSENVFPIKTGYRFIQLDITDREQVHKIADDVRPDVIIHGAAMTQVDPCEEHKDLANLINIEGTRNIAELAEECRSQLVYVSTDFVFDGESGPYSEDSQVNPVSHYGYTKLAGERICSALSVPWSIVRTILVFGVTPAMSRSNLVLWVKASLESGKAIRVVDDQFRMPTLVDDLAWGIKRIVDIEASGIYHLCGKEMHSVYELAIKVAEFFNLDESLISPISSGELNEIGKRPPKTFFNLEKAIKSLDYQPKSFVEGLVVVQNLLEKIGKA